MVESLASAYSPATAAAFVRGANPGQHDESVLSVLSSEPPTVELETRLLGVVRDSL